MSVATRRYTYHDLLTTPDDGNRYEIIDGELFVSASPLKAHVWLSNAWAFWLTGHVRERDLGAIFHGPVDVRFDDESTVVPDIIFIRKERLHIFDRSYVTESPDLIVEFHSPSTKHLDLGRKFQLYQRYRVPEYWAVDPERRDLSLFVLSAQGIYERRAPVEGRLQSSVLPELTIDFDEIFRDLP